MISRILTSEHCILKLSISTFQNDLSLYILLTFLAHWRNIHTLTAICTSAISLVTNYFFWTVSTRFLTINTKPTICTIWKIKYIFFKECCGQEAVTSIHRCRIWGSHTSGYEEIFWDITLCNPKKVKRNFGGTCCLYSGSKDKPRKKQA
jgi:hypothetical protein